MSLISELRRRNVLRMAAAYLAGSWLLLQIVETMLPAFEFDDVVLRYFVIILSIGFIPTMAISWAFEWTPDGLKRCCTCWRKLPISRWRPARLRSCSRTRTWTSEKSQPSWALPTCSKVVCKEPITACE